MGYQIVKRFYEVGTMPPFVPVVEVQVYVDLSIAKRNFSGGIHRSP